MKGVHAESDPAWTPFIVTPSHPEYPAAHTTVGGIFGVTRRDYEGCPRRIRFGLGVAIGIAGPDGSNWAPEHVRVLRIPSGDQRIRHRSNANRLETSGAQYVH